MDFHLGEELELIQQSAREFAQAELTPYAGIWDQEERFPAEAIQKAAELGFLGLTTPERYGGSDLGNLALAVVLEELNAGCASTGVTISVHSSLVCYPIAKWGTDEQKEKYLPKLSSGEWLGAYSLTETEAGSDAANQQTFARRDGDHYVLNGTKIFVTTGAQADLIVVYARTNREERTRGISAFLVEPKDLPGFTVGKKEAKMGIRASSTVELVLEDVRVPASALLGKEGEGFKIALHTLDGGRIGIGAQALGIGRVSLEASIKYAKEREQFGKPIGSFQAIQWKLADMATQLDAARMMVHRAAWLRDRGEPCTQQAAMAKLMAARVANFCADEAVQIHGGAGYTTDFPVERYFRDARITEIYEGATDIQRLVIARGLLG
ncbi:MAG: acyl-CoA dehydrogenase family protein [Planctomycetes bacterium]|nr:acyl-CoA dehydrogenase family protein [Planctomycetota bacterium]